MSVGTVRLCSTVVASAASAFSTSTWNHVAAVYVSATGTCTLYLNGVQVGQATGVASPNPGASPSLTIGGAPYFGYDFTGYLDDVRVTNAARYTSA